MLRHDVKPHPPPGPPLRPPQRALLLLLFLLRPRPQAAAAAAAPLPHFCRRLPRLGRLAAPLLPLALTPACQLRFFCAAAAPPPPRAPRLLLPLPFRLLPPATHHSAPGLHNGRLLRRALCCHLRQKGGQVHLLQPLLDQLLCKACAGGAEGGHGVTPDLHHHTAGPVGTLHSFGAAALARSQGLLTKLGPLGLALGSQGLDQVRADDVAQRGHIGLQTLLLPYSAVHLQYRLVPPGGKGQGGGYEAGGELWAGPVRGRPRGRGGGGTRPAGRRPARRAALHCCERQQCSAAQHGEVRAPKQCAALPSPSCRGLTHPRVARACSRELNRKRPTPELPTGVGSPQGVCNGGGCCAAAPRRQAASSRPSSCCSASAGTLACAGGGRRKGRSGAGRAPFRSGGGTHRKGAGREQQAAHSPTQKD